VKRHLIAAGFGLGGFFLGFIIWQATVTYTRVNVMWQVMTQPQQAPAPRPTEVPSEQP
jgi:hypothetical protein